MAHKYAFIQGINELNLLHKNNQVEIISAIDNYYKSKRTNTVNVPFNIMWHAILSRGSLPLNGLKQNEFLIQNRPKRR